MYLVNEIQEVYRLQGVTISDKHIETIVRQMLRWVKIEEVGDTAFLVDQQTDRFRFNAENQKVLMEGGRPAIGRSLLLGITKASLSTDSFISAASFQETTPRFDRGFDQRKHRHAARPQGKRHRRPLDPCRNRNGVLPATSSSPQSWRKQPPRSSRK